MYGQIDSDIRKRLAEIVGAAHLLSDPEKMVDYGHDEFSQREIARLPDVVIKPASAEEVSLVMRLADEKRIPVTPRGGATGLCGGCVPIHGGIVLSLERMNRLLEVDVKNQMAVVEAGVTLGEFARAVEEAGLSFPPHPGDESAMIGGLIATNAGGSRAIKYGGIRNYVRGLEVVLPRGPILTLGGKLIKSSTGYNLLHLMVGSEGTLGIITRAIIQVLPGARLTRSLVIPFEELENAIESVPAILDQKVMPLAVEFMEAEVIRITEDFLRKRWPVAAGKTYLLVILDGASETEIDRESEAVAEVCLEQGGVDVFVADTAKKQETVLEIRSKIYEAIKSHTVEILDISLPRAEIPAHVRRVQEVAKELDIWLPTFGHAADGNVHTHIMRARYVDGKMVAVPEEEWRSRAHLAREKLYADCRARGGVISGEHGIGLVKKPFLSLVLDEVQLELMRGIKKLFDPHLILNPGKIFDV